MSDSVLSTASLAEQQIDLMPIGICMVDEDFNIASWNRILARWTGIPAEKAVGSNLLVRYPHLKAAKFLRRIKGVFRSGQPVLFSPSTTQPFMPIVSEGKGAREWALHRIVIETVGDQTGYAQISLTDVTAQYREILALRRAKELHQISRSRVLAILETAVDSIITITSKGVIESYNSAAARIFGYSATEIVGKNISLLMPSPYREKHDGYLADYLKTGKKHIIGIGREVVGRRKDGTIFPVHLSVSEVGLQSNDTKESFHFFTGIIRDLTAQKRTEMALAQQTSYANSMAAEAEAANLTKSEFLANMSHEIRTPMTGILGFTDLLLDNLTDPENIEYARTVHKNGNYLLELINDILDLSKIEADKCEVEPIEFSPHEIIAEIASLTRVRATAKGLPLNVRFDSPIPEVIKSDPTRLRQILINVIGNAIKFTETGSIQIVTRLLSEPGEEPKLQFDVIDTGIGIPADKMEKLFLPFTQADNSTTRRFGGTGLGLTISKRLTELLGGEVSVTSTLGKGSKFTITISTGPLDNVRMSDHIVESGVEIESAKVVDKTEARLQSCRVLLVEDGLTNQRLIDIFLETEGAEVSLADNGQIGFDLATAAISEGGPFDVILMDMQMPVLDGYEATRKLRDAGCTSPIIALTANAMDGDKKKCLDAGCDDYATKPIDREKLISLVAQYAPEPKRIDASDGLD